MYLLTKLQLNVDVDYSTKVMLNYSYVSFFCPDNVSQLRKEFENGRH